MKKYISILVLLISIGYCFGQEKQTTQTNTTYKNAEYPGGDSAFSHDFLKMVHGYIDLSKYAVNGEFAFIFDIGTDGKISNIDVLPKVKNSEMFIEDMQFAMKKVKKRWKPAFNNGLAVVSKKVIRINFTTDHFDHD